MAFHWSQADSKSPQVSRTLLSILADLSNAVAWVLPTHPLISNTSRPCTNPLMIVPSTSVIVGITVIFMSHSCCFFQFPCKNLGSYLSFCFPSVLPYGHMEQLNQLMNRFLLFWLSQDLVVWPILGDPFVSQNLKELSASYFVGRILGCAYTICSHG